MESWVIAGIALVVGVVSSIISNAISWGVMKQKLAGMKEQRLEDRAVMVSQRINDQAIHAADRLSDAAKWQDQKAVDNRHEVSIDSLERMGLKIMFRDQCADLRVGCRNEWIKDIGKLEAAMEKGFTEVKAQIKEYRDKVNA